MNNFEEIVACIGSDLEEFEKLLSQVVSSNHVIIDEILDHIFESKGKRIRPILVYLTARLFSKPTISTHNAALLVEIIHTATLLHDDVVDRATRRRGSFTVNAKWDDKTAILSGDFLFSKAMKITTDNKEYNLFDIVTHTIMSLSLGELIQMQYSKKFDIDEEQYYEIIKDKTASLLSACCESGAYTAGATKEDINYCKDFGEVLGYIFQIKDDVLDYIENGNSGKGTGIDIKEKKVTLPLICAWNNMTEQEKDELVGLWNFVDKKPGNIKNIIRIVNSKGGIQGCEKEMLKLRKKALAILDKFDDSAAKNALVGLIDFIIERDR